MSSELQVIQLVSKIKKYLRKINKDGEEKSAKKKWYIKVDYIPTNINQS